jgi:hypothetical protein
MAGHSRPRIVRPSATRVRSNRTGNWQPSRECSRFAFRSRRCRRHVSGAAPCEPSSHIGSLIQVDEQARRGFSAGHCSRLGGRLMRRNARVSALLHRQPLELGGHTADIILRVGARSPDRRGAVQREAGGKAAKGRPNLRCPRNGKQTRGRALQPGPLSSNARPLGAIAPGKVLEDALTARIPANGWC